MERKGMTIQEVKKLRRKEPLKVDASTYDTEDVFSQEEEE